MPPRALLLIVLLGLTSAAPVAAQNPAVAEAETQKTLDRIGSVQRDVLAKYDDSLAELQAGFQKSADLEGALAIRAERQRLTRDGALTEKQFVAEPKALRALQTQTLARMNELVSQLLAEALPKLIELKKQFTVAGKLDEALVVRSSIEKLQNAFLPPAKLDAGALVAAETLLTAYSADRARADKTYKGQKFTVRGVVGGFRPDPADVKNFHVFLTGGAAGGWIQCQFGPGENRFREEKAAFNVPVLVITGKDNEATPVRLQKGSLLDVRGVCEGWEESVRLGRCELSK
jgi:hypothetical protein